MKRLILVFLFVATPAFAGDYVRGHWKDTDHDGVKDTYVDPYYRSSPNNSTSDNYSTKGNYNPYTGKEGTVNPDKQYNSTPSYDYWGNRKRGW